MDYSYLPNIKIQNFNESMLNKVNKYERELLTNSSFPTKELSMILNKIVKVNDEDVLFIEPFIDFYTQRGSFVKMFEDKSSTSILLSYSFISNNTKDKLISIYDYLKLYETDSLILTLMNKYEEKIKSLIDDVDSDVFEEKIKTNTVLVLLMTIFFYKKINNEYGQIREYNFNLKNIVHLINLSYSTMNVSFHYDLFFKGKKKDKITSHSLHLSTEEINDFISMIYSNIVFGLKFDFLLNTLSTSIEEKKELSNAFFKNDKLKLSMLDTFYTSFVSEFYLKVTSSGEDNLFNKYHSVLNNLFNDTNLLVLLKNKKYKSYKLEYKYKFFKQSFIKKLAKKEWDINESIINDFNHIQKSKEIIKLNINDYVTQIQNYLNLTYRYNEDVTILYMYKTVLFFNELFKMSKNKNISQEQLIELINQIKNSVHLFYELVKDIKSHPQKDIDTQLNLLDIIYNKKYENQKDDNNQFSKDEMQHLKNFLF